MIIKYSRLYEHIINGVYPAEPPKYCCYREVEKKIDHGIFTYFECEYCGKVFDDLKTIVESAASQIKIVHRGDLLSATKGSN